MRGTYYILNYLQLVLLFYSILQSFVSTMMTHKLSAHMIHYIIPAIKEHVSVGDFISAIKKTSSFTLDFLYCLMGISEGRIGMHVCMCHCACVYMFLCMCFMCVHVCVCVCDNATIWGQRYCVRHLLEFAQHM